MSRPIIGKVCEFNIEVESFENYIERLEQFFLANNVKDQDKVPLFITLIGPEVYATLKSLLVPDLPKDKNYKEIISTLTKHYVPTKNITYERFIFNRRQQNEGETISDYAIALKKLASTCKYESFLDEALRDRFLCGIKSDSIQSRLLSEGDNLTFNRSLEMALVLEDAQRNVKSLHPDSYRTSVSEVNFVPTGNRPSYINQKKYNSEFRPKFNKTYKQQATTRPISVKACNGCGRPHEYFNCPYKGYICNNCNRKGHLAKVCRSKPNTGRSSLEVSYCDDDESMNEDMNNITHNTILDINPVITESKSNCFETSLLVNGVPLKMVIDTGAVVSVMPNHAFLNTFKDNKPELFKSSIKLKTYTGHTINVLGEFQAEVTDLDRSYVLPMVVVQSDSPKQPTLLGRNWLEKVRIDWKSIIRQNNGLKSDGLCEISGKNFPISELKNRYSPVFDVAFGEIKNIFADLILKENSTPIFCKARNVPYALRPTVDAELDNLEQNNVIYKVNQSEWASPVVVVDKGNGKVRICGDFKVTINQCLRTDHYPLPNPEDIFAKISGAKFFTKLDLASAYNQLRVSDASQELLTINTHRGLYRYRRLPFGITSAGSIFQATMDKILHGIKNTFCYLDDILLISRSEEEMHNQVETVLARLMEYGVKINAAKSEFCVKSLVFLGHRLSSDGIRPSEELTEAITNAPRPEDVTQLKSYLGLLNYYGKFLPNLSTLLHPLYRLLNSQTKWLWCKKCEHAFTKSKELLINSAVLMPYDPNLEIIVTCDASAYGVGAVISHQLPDGTERPIAFSSRTLTKYESRYAQIEREALAIIFAVKKFHVFLYGRKFILASDHQPLSFLLGANKAIPALAAARIQRWALILAAYQYQLVHRRGSDIPNADALSRLPCKAKEEDLEIAFFSVSQNELPITYKEIGLATKYDPTLSKVLDHTLNGWPNYIEDNQLKPYYSRSSQLSVEQQCILWGSRVVIPEAHREEILSLLHKEHPGESRMKALSRSFVWWPGLDQNIEEVVKQCKICQSTRKSIPLAPLQQWSWPKHCWQRLHIDFASFRGQDFLIIVDSHSKWIEVFYMSSTTSAKTIEKLRSCFAAYGLPSTVVTDGGPQLVSQEFRDFLKSNGVLHVITPPYHPSSNGLAERAVQTTKGVFLKQLLEDAKSGSQRSLQHRIDSFLFTYRNTPHSITGICPADIFLKFKPRTRLTLLKPHLSDQMTQKKHMIELTANAHRGKPRSFQIGDKVFVRSVRQEIINWYPGVVIKVISPMTYLVQVEGRKRFVHADHLRVNETQSNEEQTLPVLHYSSPIKITTSDHQVTKTPQKTKSCSPPRKSLEQEDRPLLTTNQEPATKSVITESKLNPQECRRSQRVRRATQKLNL